MINFGKKPTADPDLIYTISPCDDTDDLVSTRGEMDIPVVRLQNESGIGVHNLVIDTEDLVKSTVLHKGEKFAPGQHVFGAFTHSRKAHSMTNIHLVIEETTGDYADVREARFNMATNQYDQLGEVVGHINSVLLTDIQEAAKAAEAKEQAGLEDA